MLTSGVQHPRSLLSTVLLGGKAEYKITTSFAHQDTYEGIPLGHSTPDDPRLLHI